MIQDIEFGILAALGVANFIALLMVLRALAALLVQRKSSSAAPAAPSGETVAILVRGQRTGRWEHHSFRPEGHRDILEALETPGMAIMRDGKIEEGKQ